MTASLTVDKTIPNRKVDILTYFRHRAAEFLAELKQKHGERQFRKRSAAVNRALIEERERLLTVLRQTAEREKWTHADILPCVLLITHCTNVVMLESRNSVWPYEYMSFSRRVGELWEPFCTLCFDAPMRSDFALFVPPVFSDVRKRLAREIEDFIRRLPLSQAQKDGLLGYYNKVWSLVTSGAIKLALDLHFTLGESRYVVDFKSGFGSNEKGNTNRLLLVASVYRNIEPEDYRCILLVRSDENNHYLETLRNSGLWEV